MGAVAANDQQALTPSARLDKGQAGDAAVQLDKNINDRPDNANEEAAWWEETVWELHRDVFLESVNGEECFTPNAFKWALTLVDSRAVFLDGRLCLVPVLNLPTQSPRLPVCQIY